MRYILFLLFGAIMMSCSELPKKPDAVNGTANNYKIAFNVLLDTIHDNYEVFVMNLDGSNKKNITNLKGVEWTYNAYGKELYLISDKDTTHRYYYLYRTNSEGGTLHKVTNIRLADSWINSRNNGRELIVEPHRSVDTAFYILDYSGQILKKITPDLPYFNDANFSPDGKKIVFRGANKPFKKDIGYVDELFIMNDDGSNMQQLTSYPKNDTTAMWYNYHAGPPMWHPTENFISYNSVQNGKSSLYAVSPDGTKQWKLTQGDTLQQGWHSWSPDGKWLAIEVYTKDERQFHIQLMHWETKETNIITDATYRFQQAPVFVAFD